MDEIVVCRRCQDVLVRGDDYYDTPLGAYCPDCYEALVDRLWKKTVGDTVDRI